MAAAPPPATTAGELDHLKNSSSSCDDLPICKAEEEIDRGAIDSTNDAQVAQALYEVTRTLEPELVLPMVPPLSMHRPEDVDKARTLVACGATPAMFAEAAAGALLRSSGVPSIAYVCGTLEHFNRHLRRKREHDAALAKQKQRELRELAHTRTQLVEDEHIYDPAVSKASLETLMATLRLAS
jgi:hypothetical protein